MNEVVVGGDQICASNAVMNSWTGRGGSDATHTVHAFEGGTNLSVGEPPPFFGNLRFGQGSRRHQNFRVRL